LSEAKKGKDLSALKARLAKKAAAGDGPEDAAAPPEAAAVVAAEIQAAAVAEIPAPGEVRPPMPDIPAPGEVRKPVDIPAPGEVRKPDPAPVAVAAPVAAKPAPREALGEDLFSGGRAFDPNAGVIEDVGDIKPRSNLGLPMFAGVIGLVVGLGLGWMGHKVTDSNARVASAKAKADEIKAKVKLIEDERARVALKIGDAESALGEKSGEKLAAALGELNGEPIEIAELFGWQLASMDPEAVKAFLKLANGYNAMLFQAELLKALALAKTEVLTAQVGGPTTYILVKTPEGTQAVLAEKVSAICEEIPEPEGETPPDYAKLKRCGEGEAAGATAYEVRTELGGATSVVKADQVMVLVPNPIYSFAIGTNPDKAIVDEVMFRMGSLKKFADDLKRSSDKAAEGAEALSSDPQVDG
jgi:hypothetical protein